MDPTPDELAGVVDLFGALSRPELRRAFEDLAARGGEPFDPDDLDEHIDDALRGYYIVCVERDATEDGDGSLLVPGPAALPTLPEHGEDLPHIMSVEERSVPSEALGRAAEERLREDAARAVQAGDRERIRALLDACYDVEAWAPVDAAPIRDRLDAALDTDGGTD